MIFFSNFLTLSVCLRLLLLLLLCVRFHFAFAAMFRYVFYVFTFCINLLICVAFYAFLSVFLCVLFLSLHRVKIQNNPGLLNLASNVASLRLQWAGRGWWVEHLTGG